MRNAPRLGFALALAIGLTAPAMCQQIAAPDYVWAIRSGTDTVFERPRGLAADPAARHVFVTDVFRRRIAVVDAATGVVLRVAGREGDGPGEFRAPDLVAISPRRDLIAIYDVGSQTVEILSPMLGFVARRQAQPVVMFPKGLGLLQDTTVVVTGGIHVMGDSVHGVHWLLPRQLTLASTPPDVARMDGSSVVARRDPREYVAGGPTFVVGSNVFVADASTGDVWAVRPGGARLVDSGPGAPIGLLDRMIVRGEDPRYGPYLQPWWTFPQAVLLDTLPQGGFLVALSVQDSSIVHFFELKARRSPRHLGDWRARLSRAVAYDRVSCIVIVEEDGGGYVIGRARYPFAR